MVALDFGLAREVDNLRSTSLALSPVYAAPEMIAFAARVGQQVSSTNTGGFPGPAQTARLPVFIAAATTAGPPVTQSSFTFACLHITSKVSSVGFTTVVSRSEIPIS